MRPRTGAVFPLGSVEFCTTASARPYRAAAHWQEDRISSPESLIGANSLSVLVALSVRSELLSSSGLTAILLSH
jgi:hypothetical protein